MKKFLWLVAFSLIGLGLEEPVDNDYAPYNDAYMTLQAEYPNAHPKCLEIAANTMIGNYEAVSDQMASQYGRCATRVLGLVVRVDVNGHIN